MPGTPSRMEACGRGECKSRFCEKELGPAAEVGKPSSPFSVGQSWCTRKPKDASGRGTALEETRFCLSLELGRLENGRCPQDLLGVPPPSLKPGGLTDRRGVGGVVVALF